MHTIREGRVPLKRQSHRQCIPIRVNDGPSIIRIIREHNAAWRKVHHRSKK